MLRKLSILDSQILLNDFVLADERAFRKLSALTLYSTALTLWLSPQRGIWTIACQTPLPRTTQLGVLGNSTGHHQADRRQKNSSLFDIRTHDLEWNSWTRERETSARQTSVQSRKSSHHQMPTNDAHCLNLGIGGSGHSRDRLAKMAVQSADIFSRLKYTTYAKTAYPLSFSGHGKEPTQTKQSIYDQDWIPHELKEGMIVARNRWTQSRQQT